MPLPKITVACLCEKVLAEADGVISLIRIVDRFNVRRPPHIADGQSITTPITLFLGLQSVETEGPHEVVLQLHGPTTSAEPLTVPVEAQPGSTGINLTVLILVGVERFGHGRIDVVFDGADLTSVPFTIAEADEPRVAAPKMTQ